MLTRTAQANKVNASARAVCVCVCVSSGWKGNVCERSLASGVSLLLLAPCAALAVYLMLLQTMVLRLELLLSAILLTFYLLELLLGLLALSAFSRLVDYWKM